VGTSPSYGISIAANVQVGAPCLLGEMAAYLGLPKDALLNPNWTIEQKAAYNACYDTAVIVASEVPGAAGPLNVANTIRGMLSLPHIWGLLAAYAREKGWIHSDTGTLTISGAQSLLQVVFDLVSAIMAFIAIVSRGEDVGDILESFVEPLWDTIIDVAWGGLIEQWYRIKRGTEEMDPDDYSELLSYDGVGTSVGLAVTAAQTGASNLAAVGLWVRGRNTSLIDVGRAFVDAIRSVLDAADAWWKAQWRALEELYRRSYEDILDIWYYIFDSLDDVYRELWDTLVKLYVKVGLRAYPPGRETELLTTVFVYAQYAQSLLDRLAALADKIEAELDSAIILPSLSHKAAVVPTDVLAALRAAEVDALKAAFAELKQIRNLQ